MDLKTRKIPIMRKFSALSPTIQKNCMLMNEKFKKPKDSTLIKETFAKKLVTNSNLKTAE